jgi:hypothetical protein
LNDNTTETDRVVEFFLQTQQPDGSWNDSSSRMDDVEWARERLATRRVKMPQWEHRIVWRATSVSGGVLADGERPAVVPSVDRAALHDRIEVWPLNRVLTEVRCGSQDWTWDEEWADLDQRHEETGYLLKLEQQIRENGITMPVLIGTDGRLWDGHHRLRIAVRLGIGYVPVELADPGADAVLPAPADRAAVLTEAAAYLNALPLSGVEAGVRAALTAVLRRLGGEAAPDNTETPCSASHPHEPHDWLPFPGSGLVHKGVVHCRGREEASHG